MLHLISLKGAEFESPIFKFKKEKKYPFFFGLLIISFFIRLYICHDKHMFEKIPQRSQKKRRLFHVLMLFIRIEENRRIIYNTSVCVYIASRRLKYFMSKIKILFPFITKIYNSYMSLFMNKKIVMQQ